MKDISWAPSIRRKRKGKKKSKKYEKEKNEIPLGDRVQLKTVTVGPTWQLNNAYCRSLESSTTCPPINTTQTNNISAKKLFFFFFDTFSQKTLKTITFGPIHTTHRFHSLFLSSTFLKSGPHFDLIEIQQNGIIQIAPRVSLFPNPACVPPLCGLMVLTK